MLLVVFSVGRHLIALVLANRIWTSNFPLPIRSSRFFLPAIQRAPHSALLARLPGQAQPAGQHAVGLLDALALGRGEQLHADVLSPALANLLLHLEQGVPGGAEGQLVCL